MKSLLVIGMLIVAGLGLWLVPQGRVDGETLDGGGMVADSASITPRDDETVAAGAVGTTGTHDGAAEAEGGDVVTEIETITGATDGMSLVGRRVDLHVDVHHPANERAFWVGPAGNRVLVVLAHDTRDATQRQKSMPSTHLLSPVRGGQRAAILGVIRPVRHAEETHGWNLSADDRRTLDERKIYIRAASVRAEGHGVH